MDLIDLLQYKENTFQWFTWEFIILQNIFAFYYGSFFSTQLLVLIIFYRLWNNLIYILHKV